MRNWKEPHWSEGMLLLPQHMQIAHRFWDAMVAAVWDSSPFSWGLAELVLAEAQIRNGSFAVQRCTLRTPDGTWLVVPDNAEVADRRFGEWLDKSPDGMLVYVGVPRLHEIRPNATCEVGTDGRPVRYFVEALERNDENTGENAQQVEVHSYRGQLFFGDESKTPGYETIPIARLYRSGEEGGAPRRDTTYIPPVLRIGASDELMRMLKEIVNDVGARATELAAEVGKREMSFRSGAAEHVERLLMLDTLNTATAYFRQVAGVLDYKPHAVYLELCRLAGQLAVYSDPRSAPEYPIYDHYALTEQFRLICEHIRALLRPFATGNLQWRDFVPRESGKGLRVAIDEAWLSDQCEMYVGIHDPAHDDVELDRLLKSMNWKIASEEDVDGRYDAGLHGLSLQPVRAAMGVLPAGKDIKYYQVFRDDEVWPKVKVSQTLAIRYSPAGQARLEGIKFKVYVVTTNPA
jgi:type VI secretion system protein ImpJ